MIVPSSEKKKNFRLPFFRKASASGKRKEKPVRSAPALFSLFGRGATAILCLGCMTYLVLRPDLALPAAKKGLALWAGSVVPALLPFFFLTALLSSTGVTERWAKRAERPMRLIFRQSGICFNVFLTSALSGYPVGAKLISELRKKKILGREDATRAACLCSTSGPLFIVGSVGTALFGNPAAGGAIYAAHLVSAVLCGLIFRFYGKTETNESLPVLTEKSANVLYDAAYNSVISVLLVGSFICLFYILADGLSVLGVLRPAERAFSLILRDEASAKAFVCGLIECTSGCAALAALSRTSLTVSLAAACVSFGGFSVVAQSLLFLGKDCCDRRIFLLSKTVQTVLSFFLCLLFFR